MIERDYILVLIRQMAQVLARLLFLKKDGDKKQMQFVVYEGLKLAGLKDPLQVDETEVNNIEDPRLLASLSELLTCYLADEHDEKLEHLNELINRRLKEKNTLILKI